MEFEHKELSRSKNDSAKSLNEIAHHLVCIKNLSGLGSTTQKADLNVNRFEVRWRGWMRGRRERFDRGFVPHRGQAYPLALHCGSANRTWKNFTCVIVTVAYD